MSLHLSLRRFLSADRSPCQHASRHSSPSTGSPWGGFPGFVGTMECSDHCFPSRSLGVASLRGTYLSTRCFALSTAGCVPPPESWELLCGIPHPLVLLIGVAVPLKFLGNPSARTPRSETPPGPAHRLYVSWLLLTMRPNGPAIGLGISRLSDAACALPVYASQVRIAPHPRKTRFRRSPTLPGGVGYPPGSNSRFHFFAWHLLSGLS